MAKKRRKTNNLTVRQRFKLIVTLLAAFAVGVCALLDYTGILTFDDLLIKANLKDKPAQYADTQVHFVDVGQGDCTLIVSDGEAMVIDSGDEDKLNRAVSYIKSQGITDIEYLIATHPHSDHIGEMPEIFEQFSVHNFIMPKLSEENTPTTKIYERLLEAVKNEGIAITAAADCEFELGSCTVQLFTPKEEDDNLNNVSTIVKIIHGENSFLITGDCETQEEKDILSQGFDISAKVLKAGHHGSSTSSSAEFLDAVLPRYAVISCGEDNNYGHPHEQTVTRLYKYADEIYITKDVGSIVFSSDGEGLTVETEKGNDE